MREYLNLLERVLYDGEERSDRTGVGTLSVFGTQTRYNLQKGFPLLTTKKVHLKSIIHELLWFLKGDTNIKYLNDNGVKIWDEWADDNGDLGPIYGHQFRRWELNYDEMPIDQISKVVQQLKEDLTSRRIILSTWNVGDLPHMALPPCHCLAQFYVDTEYRLSCQMYQRSGDLFLGVPFNIASYSLLTMMLAQVCKLNLGEFIHTIGDAHIYKNHLEQVKLQLNRAPMPLPKMQLNPEVKNIFDFKYEDFTLTGYTPWDSIKAEVAV